MCVRSARARRRILNSVSVCRSASSTNRYEHVVAWLKPVRYRRFSMRPIIIIISVSSSIRWQRRRPDIAHTSHNCSYRITINISHFNAIDTTLQRSESIRWHFERCVHAQRTHTAPFARWTTTEWHSSSSAYLPPTVSRCLSHCVFCPAIPVDVRAGPAPYILYISTLCALHFSDARVLDAWMHFGTNDNTSVAYSHYRIYRFDVSILQIVHVQCQQTPDAHTHKHKRNAFFLVVRQWSRCHW